MWSPLVLKIRHLGRMADVARPWIQRAAARVVPVHELPMAAKLRLPNNHSEPAVANRSELKATRTNIPTSAIPTAPPSGDKVPVV